MRITRYVVLAVTALAAVSASVGLSPLSVNAQVDRQDEPPPSIEDTYRMHAERTSILPPVPMQCSEVYNWARDDREPAGEVCFWPHGDQFWIKDHLADGLYIQMRAVSGGHHYHCYTTRTSASGWQVCRGTWWASRIRENGLIVFGAYLYSRNSDGSFSHEYSGYYNSAIT